MIYSTHDRESVPRSLQLVAGRVGQEYNQRKKRKGAFGEDRYHATAVDTEEHLVRCLVYIDFHPVKCRKATPALAGFHWVNMVRAGVVDHPGEWRHGGWHEIVDPPRRYRIIARNRLKQLLDADEKTLTDSYAHWVEDYIQEGTNREKIWTESVAVGSAEFVEGIYPVKLTKSQRSVFNWVKSRLGLKARHRGVRRQGKDESAMYTLQEPIAAYSDDFGGKIIYPMKQRKAFLLAGLNVI